MKKDLHDLIIDHLNRLVTLADNYHIAGNITKAEEIRALVIEYSNISPRDKERQQEAYLKLSEIQ